MYKRRLLTYLVAFAISAVIMPMFVLEETIGTKNASIVLWSALGQFFLITWIDFLFRRK
jgi:hypothetical protein